MGGVMPPVTLEEIYQDRIARAVGRERAHRRVVLPSPEYETIWDHVFTCVCCGRVRGDEVRREPASEVCMRCVRAAGFRN